MRSASCRLAGWGNYPREDCWVSRPETFAALREIVVRGEQPDYIPRGLGRSYGDSSLNRHSGVILQDRLSRFLHFDQQTGVLECEAGVSFAEIIDACLPLGWFLPTTPGTKFVTVGGAIAADVHGKSHHRSGSFGRFVQHLRLLTAGGEILSCSPRQNASIFWATVGSMGLTGCILDARIQLVPVETAFVDVRYRRTQDLEETLACFSETDRQYQYSVAWIDCASRGRSLGRSVLMLANPAQPVDVPSPYQSALLEIPRRRQRSVPCQLPGCTLNRWTVRAFNSLYYARHHDGREVVDFDTFFYPLDRVLHWNRIYGRRGFVQYQALFPRATSRQGLVRMLEKISASGLASFLAVLKSCGPADEGLLSYLDTGHTLALDFPYAGNRLRDVLRALDRILLDHGGRLYLAKDATMSADVFAAMYPNLPKFQAVKAIVDPQNRFVSSQARRVGIVPTA